MNLSLFLCCDTDFDRAKIGRDTSIDFRQNLIAHLTWHSKDIIRARTGMEKALEKEELPNRCRRND